VAKTAKPERGAKSTAIREYLKAHPKARVQDVVDELKKQGITVSAALVNNIKYTKKKPGKRGRKRGRPAATKPSNGSANVADRISLQALVEVKKTAERLGGIDELQKAAAALAKLQQQ
jgi:hypothetical protein